MKDSADFHKCLQLVKSHHASDTEACLLVSDTNVSKHANISKLLDQTNITDGGYLTTVYILCMSVCMSVCLSVLYSFHFVTNMVFVDGEVSIVAY